jgi:hypothetical protein
VHINFDVDQPGIDAEDRGTLGFKERHDSKRVSKLSAPTREKFSTECGASAWFRHSPMAVGPELH